jgi:hypothetical protein
MNSHASFACCAALLRMVARFRLQVLPPHATCRAACSVSCALLACCKHAQVRAEGAQGKQFLHPRDCRGEGRARSDPVLGGLAG